MCDNLSGRERDDSPLDRIDRANKIGKWPLAIGAANFKGGDVRQEGDCRQPLMSAFQTFQISDSILCVKNLANAWGWRDEYRLKKCLSAGMVCGLYYFTVGLTRSLIQFGTKRFSLCGNLSELPVRQHLCFGDTDIQHYCCYDVITSG